MEAADIISKAESSNVAGLYGELRSYLEPLNGLLGFEGSTVQIHGLAKRYVPFLGRFLKISCQNLAHGISPSETEQKRAEELFRALKFALDCLDALRTCLVGNPHEIEVQRYWMVRRLMAWKRFTEAREECWVILHKLRVNIFCKDERGKKELVASARKGSVKKKEVTTSSRRKKDVGVSLKKTKENENGVDLCGELAETADSGLVGLVLGLVTDLIICTGESKIKVADEYRKILVFIDQLMPWQRVSDKSAIEKHRSMLFKGLHKCVLFMASEPCYFDLELTRTFVFLALDNCARSLMKDRFVKVACGICRQLASGGPDHSSIVVDICKLAVNTIFKGLQWQIYGENEINDVVDFYCHHCETSAKLSKDAKQFLHATANTCGQGLPFHLPAVLHIYGVGMGFKDFEVSGLCNDGVDYIDCEMSEVRFCCKNDDKELLSNLVQMFQSMVEEFQKSSGDSECGKHGYRVTSCCIKSNAALRNHDHIWTGKSLITIFRALEFLYKASAQCVQQEWDFFVANATNCRPAWFSSLEQAFVIFPRVFFAVLGCDFIPLEEKKELHWGRQTVVLAATAALKLSLMDQKHSQESFEIIEAFISGGFVQVQDLKWLSNCTYMIGVRMYNNKQYDLASNPLKLAYTAAWRRISFVMNGSLDDYVEPECGTSSSESISELVSDACARSVVLVDVLHRIGSPLIREIITDFLTQWSSADSRLSSLDNRRALVKHWVKIVSHDSKDMELNEASVECLTLYEVLVAKSSVWPLETLGVLLEEELLAYANIETELSSLIKKRIIKLLLEDVYVTKEFSLERSRVLLEKCKAARLIGSDGLDKSIDCLSDAMFLLRKDLDENFCPSGKSYHMDCVRHQLAITYCVHAFCIQELKSDPEVILDDISSALKLWSCIYSSKLPDLNKEQKDWLFDTSVPLLLNISQLLALKGFISLQSEVQEMILQILIALKNISPEECCALLWRESRLNHTLCCIPFSANIFSTLIDKFGNAINSLKFWENSLNDHHGSQLQFQQKLMCDIFIEVEADKDFSTHSFLGSFNTIELLKDRVLTLASNGQKSIQSSFTTSNLFYILSEKCRTNGKLSEALKYSKEALLIRRKQLQRSFNFLEKKAVQLAFNNEMESFSLEAQGSVATNVWSIFSDNRKQRECGMSQWVVLGNYLESLMQVGVLYEMVGAANEAEYVFQEGLNISNAQYLPLCQAAFGSSLGEIYRKCHKWEIAEKRFQEAVNVLGQSDVEHVCKLCKVTIEAMLEMRIGDFVRRCPRERKTANFYEELTSFDIYMLAKEKLHYIGRKYYDDMPLDRKMHTECCGSNSPANKEGNAASSPKLEYDATLYSVRKNNKIDSVQDLIAFIFELHRRSLMSRLLLQIGKCHETSREFLKAYEIMLQNSSLLFFHIDGLPCLCSFVNGYHCQQKCSGWKIPVDILLFERAALLYHISWLSLQKNLPALSWTQCCGSSENLRSFVIGWLHHAFFICNQMPALLRKVSILLAIVHMPFALGGLFSAPEDYISNLSGSHWSAYFHQASLGTTLREEHLAVLDAKLASQNSDRSEFAQNSWFWQVSQQSNSSDVIERVQKVLRLTPDKLDCLEPFVTNFFRSVPLPTIVCISLLDCRYASILEVSSFSNSSPAWIFLTRFDSDGPPVVLLLPIHSAFNGTRTDAVEGSNLCSPYSIWNLEADDLKANDIGSASEVMGVVAEEFCLLLEESRLSTSDKLAVESNEEKKRWWQWRKQLDDRLGNLLRGIEDSWLGPWKCLLLGKPSEAAYCDALQTAKESIFQRAEPRKNYYNIHDNEPKKSSRKQKKQLRAEDGTECMSSESFLPCNLSNDLENLSTMCIQREPVVLVLDANSQVLPWESLPVLRNQEVYRMPSVGSISAVMISRGHLQMVDSFVEKEKKMSNRKTNTKQEILARNNPWSVALEQLPKLPAMDPYNAFYLLNPSGDLSTTQAAFEDWFKNQRGWKGKSGEVPTPEECIFALQNHDLFIYFGHGRGEQYIPERNIRRLDYCAAVVLMGCSSGRLSYRGDYEPAGVPLSYLIAGCPCIIANLWDVTDGDIDRFSRVLLHSWLEAESGHCNDLDVVEEFQNLTVSGQNSGKRVLRPRQKLKDDKTKCPQFQHLLSEHAIDKSIRIQRIRDEVRTGSCIGKCRSTCKLPYLIGASPVCYGIPTTIKHK
ncbi:separase isoform X2 [Cryptomeria japonica]|uniref:separase isoform X2 n=1 Tax=Cryptomeria japonica TaxID=3369 RepID=UPI0027DAA8ED|nr:separase isoform X2 [Cryptomeria japonica]